MNLKLKASLLIGVSVAAVTGCHGCKGAPAGAAVHPRRIVASTTPALPSPITAALCSAMPHCTASAESFRFPDGAGGTVTCAAGICNDDTSYNAGYNAGYSDGIRDGEDASASNDPEGQGREPASP